MNEWHDFFVAAAGASAALTGLIFVSVSINLSRILSIPRLPARAAISMILLLNILIVSLFMLAPNSSTHKPGIESLLAGTIVWIFALYADIRIIQNKEKQYRKIYVLNIMLNQAAILPYFIGGAILLAGFESGFHWLLLAFVFSFIKASLDAWVLLVEINR